jgi:pseudaminic acid biosynthesis-associated methylase
VNKQENLWAGKFGDEYLKRNRVPWRTRVPFWKAIMDGTWARSVYEFGCNAGFNLSAIKYAAPGTLVYGNDINETAARQARMAGLPVGHTNKISYSNNSMEMSFTAGVLIHIGPRQLESVMQSIIDVSCDHVLAIEYEAKQEEKVLYRGHADALWKRPYGELYEKMGLSMLLSGKLTKADGFDDCTYWLMKK